MDTQSKEQTSATPTIVLVQPQMGENIGMVARAMANFGFSRLRLVSPRDGWPNPQAYPASAGSEWILENARCFPNLAEACFDCHHIIATTARKQRQVAVLWKSPNEMSQWIADLGSKNFAKIALVFGSERSGLDNDDLALCDCAVTIATTACYTSLNLSHAVAIICFSLFSRLQANDPILDPSHVQRIAETKQVHRLCDQLIADLGEANYFKDSKRRHILERKIRNFWHRIKARPEEIDATHGMLRALRKSKRS